MNQREAYLEGYEAGKYNILLDINSIPETLRTEASRGASDGYRGKPKTPRDL